MYLNRCVMESSSEDVGGSGATVPFLVEPILLDLEGGRYLGPLLPGILAELVSGRRIGSGGGGSGGDSGGGINGGRDGGVGQGSGGVGSGGARGAKTVRVRYEAHLTALSLWYRENARIIMAGTVLRTVQVHVICNNWILHGLCCEDRKRKNCTSQPPPMW